MRPPKAQGYSDFFAYIILCYRPRLVRNEDVWDLDTSFERLDVHVIGDCIFQSDIIHKLLRINSIVCGVYILFNQ